MSSPLVSILIPAYNRSGMIGPAIRSALDQTSGDLEVVVVDNASTDDTWAQIQAIAAQDSRVRAFRNAENLGPVRNWLACVQRATGRFSKILWSDDLMDPRFLECCLPWIERDDVGFVVSAVRTFRDVVQDDDRMTFEHFGTGMRSTAEFIEGSLLRNDFPVSPGCALFRTRDLQSDLRLDVPNRINSDFSRHAIGNDLLLFLLVSLKYPKFATVAQPLSLFREHADSITVKSGLDRVVLHYDVVRAYFCHLHCRGTVLQRKLNALLWWHLRRLDGDRYGIRSVEDFYPEDTDSRVSISYVLWLLADRLQGRLKARGSRK